MKKCSAHKVEHFACHMHDAGSQEAAYHGVPVIGIPLMLGHNELVSHAQDHGRGILVRKETLMAGNPDALTAALLEVVNNNSYKQQVRISALEEALPYHPKVPGLLWLVDTLCTYSKVPKWHSFTSNRLPSVLDVQVC